MSSLFPTLTNLENPTLVRRAQSSMTEQMAPDWEVMAIDAGLRVLVGEGGVDLAVGVDHAQAVGAQYPHPVGTGDLADLAFQLSPVLAGLLETGGNDDGRLGALTAGLFDYSWYYPGRRGDDDQVYLVRYQARCWHSISAPESPSTWG